MPDSNSTKIYTIPDVDTSIIESFHEELNKEKQVIIHCNFLNGFESQLIRIWRTTFLNDRHSNHQSKLLHTFNIPVYPIWKQIEPLSSFKFTLIFSSLPKSCEEFDLYEEIPQSGGFFVGKIKRNKADVYSINIE